MAGEGQCPSSSSQAESPLTLPLPFVLFRPSADWMVPTQTEEGACFTQSFNSNASLFPLRHTQKYLIIFNQISTHLSSRHTKLTIADPLQLRAQEPSLR